MFAGCKNIININFRYFNTEYISNMKYMICGCKNLKSINLYSFNTKNVTDMSYMFSGCENLKNLDLYSFDTNNITDMSYMFYRCENLNNINLISFQTGKVKDMTYMFGGCENLLSLDLSSSFDINKINTIKYMFVSCDKLKHISSSPFVKNEIDILINVGYNDINKEIYFLDNYEGSSKNKHLYELTKINAKLQIDNIESEYKKFFVPKRVGKYNIKLIFNINLTDCGYMFAGCTNIININFISFDTNILQIGHTCFVDVRI